MYAIGQQHYTVISGWCLPGMVWWKEQALELRYLVLVLTIGLIGWVTLGLTL